MLMTLQPTSQQKYFLKKNEIFSEYSILFNILPINKNVAPAIIPMDTPRAALPI